MFRRIDDGLQVLIAHPGGPLWARKDAGAWTLPKGLYDVDEEPEAAALWNLGLGEPWPVSALHGRGVADLLDRAALPAPDAQSPAPKVDKIAEKAAPRTPVEETLIRIWSEVLRREDIDVHDDLFDLGADSLSIFQITSRARREGLKLAARDFFRNRTIAAVAAALTLGVVDGFNSGIGGGCFMLIRKPDGTFAAIDGRETAPGAASRDMYLRDGKARPELRQAGALAIGGPGDRDAAHTIRLVVRRERVIEAQGKLSPLATVAALQRADFYLGGDSLWTQLAVAAGVPVTALFGPSDESLRGPWGGQTLRGPRTFEEFRIMDPRFDQALQHMMDLPAERVLKACMRRLTTDAA